MELSKYRAEKGWTQQQLATALGMSTNRICEIENGSGCSLSTALKIEQLTKGLVRPADLAARVKVVRRSRPGGRA